MTVCTGAPVLHTRLTGIRVAAVVMGAYLWKAHPHLREDLRREDLEAPELTTRPSAQRERLVEQPDRS